MKAKKKFDKASARRGIYVLPNIFTSLNLFCGFYAVIAAIDEKYVAAALAIIIGNVFDILDGKIARATRTSSKFGMEYDSLADLITFGMAPGVLMFLWALRPLGRIGWLGAFLLVACGALRLARFNTQAGTSTGNHFTGLPIPAAAAMNASTVLFFNKFGLTGTIHPIFILIMLYGLSFLMVSTIRYPSFKQTELFRRMNFNVLVAVVLILIFIAYQPSIAFFFTAAAYVISGPVNTVLRNRRIKQGKTVEAD